MNHRIESMKPSASMVLMARAKEMQKTDPTVIGLAGGEPDFATPDRISMAAIRSLTEGYTHYVVGPGLPELRQAIQKKLREENDLDYDVNCIIVTPGGKNAIYLAVQAILNEGDEVMVLDPAWVSYEPIIQAAGWIPMIAFLTCVLISTSCGTSTGSVAAVAPVLLPLAHGLGINMGLMCGAIISGAIFGDNLAPISDTTISSALTQEADISQVVRTRFPYAAISGAVAAVLFAVVGLTQDANIPADLELDGSTAKSLFLLVLPVLMVILMRKGWDLMGTLILCNLSGIVLNLVLGTIAPAKMFANDGPIVAGMSGMMTLVLYVTLLFQLLEILNSSGAFDGLTVSLMKHCKSPRSGELICYLAAALGSVVTGGSGIAIVFFGSLVRRITKAFHIDRCRGANILDGVACGATGLMPHGNPTLVSLGVALAIDGVDPNFSFLDIIPYNFHCWGLMLIFLLSILTGIGRRFEKPEETANA